MLVYESVSRSVMSNSFATPSIVALQAPLSVEFSRQEYWSGLPFSLPGIEPRSPALQADYLPSEPKVSEWGVLISIALFDFCNFLP